MSPHATPYKSLNNLDACLAGLYLEEYFEHDEEYNMKGSANPSTRGEHVTSEEHDLHQHQNNQQQDTLDQSLKKFIFKPIVEVLLAVLVLLSSFLVGIGTLQSIPPIVASIAETCEMCIWPIFTVEYIIRWKINGFSPKYIIQPLAIIDLVAILPGFIKVAEMAGIITHSSVTESLINVRLLRILKLQRELTDYETFKKFELALGLKPSDTRPYQLQLARVVISIFTLLSVTSGLIYTAEHAVNPDIPDYFTALYFCLTTLSTVGFGDIHPETNAGRWIVSGAILISSAVVPAQTAALIEALLARDGGLAQKTQVLDSRPTMSFCSVNSNNNNKTENAPLKEEISPKELVARMERLEQKMDDTNKRMNLLLQALETKIDIEKPPR